MPWVRVDESLPSHPKFLGIDDRLRAIGLFVTGLCYSNLHLTDGFVPEAVVALAGKDASLTRDELVKVGSWTIVDGGYQIHDYNQYQPSKAKVLKQRRQAKRRQQRWLRAKKEKEQRRPRDASLTPTPSRPVPSPVLMNTADKRTTTDTVQAGLIYSELYRAMPTAYRAWLKSCSCSLPTPGHRRGSSVVCLHVVQVEKVEPFRAKLEQALAELHPGSTLEIVERSA